MSARQKGAGQRGAGQRGAGQRGAGEKGAGRLLHLLPSFAPSDANEQVAAIVNGLPSGFAHDFVAAHASGAERLEGLSRAVKAGYPATFPRMGGLPSPGRLQKIARAMAGYDLVLSHGWEPTDAAMARTLFADAFNLPPLIHHEHGFGPEEAQRTKRSRDFYRKLAFGRTAGLVVASETLEGIALETWDQPIGRVKHIPPGIDTSAFTARPRRDALRGVVKHEDEFWVGMRANLVAEEQGEAVLRSVAGLPDEWHVVIVGAGPERDRLRDAADALDVGHRLHLPGTGADPAAFTGLFDIAVLAREDAQAPLRVVEGMAAAAPLVAFDAGDIAQMVSEENASFIVSSGDWDAFGSALSALASNPGLRERLGKANRERARSEFAAKRMVDTYKRLYLSAMGRTSVG